MCKKDHIWDPVTCTCENGNYLDSTIDDSIITCDKVIKATKNMFQNTLTKER